MTADGETTGLNLDDADRLPWLEPAEDEPDEPRVPLFRILALVLLGLVLLGVIVGGGYWLKHRAAAGPSEARLIPAQGGDYKIPASDGAGRSFKGAGDASYAASEGVETSGKVDATKAPEAPMADVSRGSVRREDAAAKDAAHPAASVTVAVKDQTHDKARPASAAAAGAGTSGGSMIQLGAYGSDAGAREAWTKLAKRFDYLKPLTSRVEKAEIGSATLYRLRASVGGASEAATLCGRLKVAGESCIVVK